MELSPKFVAEIKAAGLVDNKGIMAGAVVLIRSPKNEIVRAYDNCILALNGETVTIVEIEKGMFGQKLNKGDLKSGYRFSTREIIESEFLNINKPKDMFAAKNRDGYTLKIDTADGTTPVLNEIIKVLDVSNVSTQ